MIITVANQKGGVGKTTTVLNLSAFLADKGFRVLVIDLDPQANLTSGLGYTENPQEQPQIKESTKTKTVYDALIGNSNIADVFIATKIRNLYLAPAGIELAGAEIELVNIMSRENILKKKLKDIKGFYDYIFIDCPPSLGLLTINALTAAEKLLIPIQCEYFALEGVGQLINTYKLVKSNINPTLELLGVVMTMYDSRTRLSKEIVSEVQSFFKTKVFETIVPRNVRLSESPSYGKPISLYDRNSEGAKAYESLASEFVLRTKDIKRV
jgi:chromosome partitioning protein